MTTLTRVLFAGWDGEPPIDVDDGVRRWLAELDPEGDPGWHDRALRTLAGVAIDHRLIGAQDAVQEALLAVHLRPDKFVAWSRARRSARFLWKAWHNLITDAVRQVHCDRRVTIDGRQYRVHPEFEIPISALALDGKATTKHWSD
jgi:DNA-directed RNA polymerase specialized sigma24 family protein